MRLEEFTGKFQALKGRGFVRSLRSGPTGVGYTFETMMGLEENNLALPDIEGIEIKAHRDNANSLITLFTFNSGAWQMDPLEAIREYGVQDDNGRLGMYYTMSLTPNSAGLFLGISDDEVAVRHTSGKAVAVWKLETLAERFSAKIPALLFVSAHAEERSDAEYFHYYRAQLMRETAGHLFSELFKAGHLLMDLRLHDKGTSARNHGTAFRVREDKLPLLFKKVEDV